MDNVADIYPLSPLQLGMLFHTLAEQAGVYINQYTCQLQGQVDAERLRQAWQQTVDQHPVLRTAFLWEGLDEPLQVVREQVTLPWEVLDWRGVADTATQLEDFLKCDRARPFNLAQAPLLRLTLIHFSDTDTQLVWTSHHLLFDGWSLPLIWQDMLAHYQGHPPAQRRPYRDFIAWQQQQPVAASESFWRGQFQAMTGTTPLPVARNSDGQPHAYHQKTRSLSVEQTTAITAFTRQQRLTLNTVVQAAWALLLHHYSGQTQVTYGSVVSGRPASLTGVENMVGLFINTLPVSVPITTDMPLVDWLQQRQQQLLELRQHEATPLQDIQRWSDSELFESIVVFENYPTAAGENLPFTVKDPRYIEQSNYPLALLVLPGDSLELILLYDTGRFEAGAITSLLDHLTMLLTAFVEQPQSLLADLPRLTQVEQQLLTASVDHAHPQILVHELIEIQAEKTPDAVAVKFEGQSLTYAALNQRANQLARQISANFSNSSDSNPFIAICLERSVDLVVAILAVLKAGAAYVPLDPTYPTARLAYCLQDTQPQLLLTQKSVLLPNISCPCLYLEDWDATEQVDNLNRLINLDDLAYVIYTSGSTGQPKGVKVSHRNLAHSTTARFQVYPDPVERFLLLSSVSFDSSVAGLFWTLCQGGCLVLAPRRIEQDLQQLAQMFAQQRITHTLCVPTLYRLLVTEAVPQQLALLKTVIVAGETCSRSLVVQHYRQLPNTVLYNEYGPTEGTVWCAAYRVPSALPPGAVSIGSPISRTPILLLDPQMQPVPMGAIGELYIGGDSVAQGYLNQPEKTAQAFLFGVSVGEQTLPYRLYRTGDLARYRADGSLEWLGRCDRQVKIRGYRIELGEIEDVLQQQEMVQEAVVVARSGAIDVSDDVESLVTALMGLPNSEAERLLMAVEEGV